MLIEKNPEYVLIEQWINTLVVSFTQNPSAAIARAITHYLTKLLTLYSEELSEQDTINFCRMYRYWSWKVSVE